MTGRESLLLDAQKEYDEAAVALTLRMRALALEVSEPVWADVMQTFNKFLKATTAMVKAANDAA